jgi:hypothetical protein
MVTNMWDGESMDLMCKKEGRVKMVKASLYF